MNSIRKSMIQKGDIVKPNLFCGSDQFHACTGLRDKELEDMEFIVTKVDLEEREYKECVWENGQKGAAKCSCYLYYSLISKCGQYEATAVLFDEIILVEIPPTLFLDIVNDIPFNDFLGIAEINKGSINE